MWGGCREDAEVSCWDRWEGKKVQISDSFVFFAACSGLYHTAVTGSGKFYGNRHFG